MSIWSQIFRTGAFHGNSRRDSSLLAFVDLETGISDKKIHDIGAINQDDIEFHEPNTEALFAFLQQSDYVCGHNIIHHDLKYLGHIPDSPVLQHYYQRKLKEWAIVDTLFVSPLLFPQRPYHKLVKDDKLVTLQLNNPVNDCKKAKELLLDEISAWRSLPVEKRTIFCNLLKDISEFAGFISLMSADTSDVPTEVLIAEYYDGRICSNSDIRSMVEEYPVELSYALAIIDTSDYHSVTPPWVLNNYPLVEHVIKRLRHTRCSSGCSYCNKELDCHYNLKQFFGYDEFRRYEGEPLQENAVRSAVEGNSLLAIFPTGGGKSLTFQLPAFIAGRAEHALTVVISPLQSLMKDQVDSLAVKGISEAVTINGLLNPVERASAIEQVSNGDASLLYIAPEMLRSKTIERILLKRNVVRFVIDEAHCFSSWGHDFRVDYLYIGKFIREYQEKKRSHEPIPISCFTATAKQKVIQDICDYFKSELNLDLKLFASSAERTNLRYSVIHSETDEDKYDKLRDLISNCDCPVIVYVSRTKRTHDLANKLSRDGFKALPFNGKMIVDEKVANQDAFMSDKVRIIVATSAFGMGVDKSNVGLVIHYDISDSLENYVQEAGRAGRDPHLEARCFVLYSDHDLDKHFILLNQTKLSISEIQQVWRSVKSLTRQRQIVSCSALEIARNAGWDDSVQDIETRIRTALASLEQSGYLVRGTNVPHIYATGITVKNMDEARERLYKSILFDDTDREKAIRVIKSLISQKYKLRGNDAESESRIDYLADLLALRKSEVISIVDRMRQEGILADSKDLSVFLHDPGDSAHKSNSLLEKFAKLERFILENTPVDGYRLSCKQLNENAINYGLSSSSEKSIRTLLYFLSIKGYLHKNGGIAGGILEINLAIQKDCALARFEKRIEISRLIIDYLYFLDTYRDSADSIKPLNISVIELHRVISEKANLLTDVSSITIDNIEESLLYLTKINALKIEGGFLVIYNAMNIRRLKDNRLQYKKEDYRMLDEFYKQKIQQVHIVGEYANLMVKSYNSALQYVQDYFQMDYHLFIKKYFAGDREKEIERNITSVKYKELFGQLSKRQMEIISDNESRCIVVAAGPGSGKTRVLVHKLASILLLEDVKHEQLLMLTFSRAAATEFKKRLISLIGNAAHYVEIKTFHSYAFDLLGRIGNLDDSDNIVSKATEIIISGEVETSKITKTILVIDEAQDMNKDEYDFIKAIIHRNEDIRVIAVGDDDQNIFEFRGSNSKYLRQLANVSGSRFIEMTENYRSQENIVAFANTFIKSVKERLKTSPIVAMNHEKGRVEIYHHQTKLMYYPLVKNVIANRNSTNKVCILTQTNEEAVIIQALLLKNGVAARLVQSLDGFRFYNLAEVKYLIKYIERKCNGFPIVNDTLWAEAKSVLSQRYHGSCCLPYVLNCMTQFEETNRKIYLSDFREFLFESSPEDFSDEAGSDVIVSTIHKSKGTEYDDVFLMLSDLFICDSNLMRRFYVGMTRAKKRLFIHTNTSYFNSISADSHLYDKIEYPMPEEVILQLSHKDVNLGFFTKRKKEVLSLKSGDPLIYSDGFLFSIVNGYKGTPVGSLSKAMKNNLETWTSKEYLVTSAYVRFIVAWKPKDADINEPETAVLLANLVLKHQNHLDY